uniref:Plug domain-containing protein n=1 Tax=Sphingomonas bacterium TaxID=1895847 RepID=UPI002607F58C|nr:Plug domain-containing protein [Sphingomonas bacterium]
MQDVIVTATRRSANLQTVPLSVTAIQADTLPDQGLKTVANLPRLVPGLSTTRGSASTNIYLRGIGTSSSGFNTEAPIATYHLSETSNEIAWTGDLAQLKRRTEFMHSGAKEEGVRSWIGFSRVWHARLRASQERCT